jgi:beta-lactamase class A
VLGLSLVLGAQTFAQSSPEAPPPPLDRLKSSIERITTSVNATWGIYIKCLETDEEIAINADRQLDTMSVIKIPLMIEVFARIKAGRLRLEDRYTLTKEDVRPGTRAPADAAAWLAAIEAARDRAAFHREGKHPFGLSTPREIGRMIEMMERGTLVDKSSSDLMLQIMRGQVYRTRIPRYLTGWRIPHKTGDFLPYIGNDVGAIEASGRTVVLSIFTANHFGNGHALEDAIGRVSEQVAAYFAYRP